MMSALIGWILIYTGFVFGGAVWLGYTIGIKESVICFIVLEIMLTLFTIGAYMLTGGE